jgi:hypothetical protein
MNTLACIDGLPALVAEQFEASAWATHTWIDWQFNDGLAVRPVVLIAGYTVSYFCPRSALDEDAVPAFEGVMFKVSPGRGNLVEVSIVRQPDGVISLLDRDSVLIATAIPGSPEHQMLDRLIIGTRNLCSGIPHPSLCALL